MKRPNKNSFESPGLVADQRGAIIVIAVFMSAFLVGGLWYIMGIGDAIVYRETVQAGADSAAFTSAVYHARGMNIIAMVNIVIGAVMAIAAAAAYLMQIASFVISVATTMCELSQQPPQTITNADGTTTVIDYGDMAFACDAILPAKELMTKLQGVIASIKASADSMLASLSLAQEEVARTAPWVGSSQAAAVASAHDPYVVSGGAGSPSMVPGDPRLGLPVQVEPFEKACNRSTAVLGKLVGLIVPAGLDEILEFLNIDVADDLPKQVCQGTNGGSQSWDFFDKDDVCEDWWERGNGNGGGNGNGNGNDPKDKCKDDLGDGDSPPPESNLVDQLEPSDKSTKGMYESARNGNDYMQVYSFVRGKVDWIKRSDRAVQVPAWGAASVAAPGSMSEELGVAQAEFFYDQTAAALAVDTCWTPPCSLSWDGYKEQALWNLRWRARLRRYRSPTDVDVNVLTSTISDLGDVAYDTGLGPYNAGVGMGPNLENGPGLGNNGFIGGGPAIIH